ncbi:MAG: replicative DNA helicase, partial [Fusobacterium necrophorum]|nr:replicative DNA helicase [Fusobacterium necrophorum]
MKSLEEISKVPHSLEAEQAILGGIFVEPDLFEEVLEIVSPEDFYKNIYSLIFRS